VIRSLAFGDAGQFALKELRLSNFKSVQDEAVPITALTVLVGPNSAGKSTILQALLVLTQAAQSAVEGGAFPLNGDLVRLGRFEDVRHARADEGAALGVGVTFGDISEGYRYRTMGRRREYSRSNKLVSISWNMSLAGQANREPGSTILHSCEFIVATEDGEIGSYQTNRRIAGEKESATAAGVGLSRMLFSRSYPGELRGAGGLPQPTVATALRGGLPVGFQVERPETAVLARWWLDFARSYYSGDEQFSTRRRKSPDPEQGLVALAHLTDLAVSTIDAYRRDYEDIASQGDFYDVVQPTLDEIRADELPFIFDSAALLMSAIADRLVSLRSVPVPAETIPARMVADYAADVAWFFGSAVKHLGPIRQEPQPFYATSATARTGHIGSRGEHLAAVLRARGNDAVDCPRVDGSSVQMTLSGAAQYWTKYLELLNEVNPRDLGRPGIELKVRPPGLPHDIDIQSVGVGVSQALPVIAVCLLADPGTTVLLEQPELHLHPAVQARLADFLVACVRSGRRLIVETHSEHIVNRLRFLVADDASGALVDTVSVVNAQRDHNGRSSYRAIRVNALGELEEWPEGFFDVGMTLSSDLLKASARRRRQLSVIRSGSEWVVADPEGGGPSPSRHRKRSDAIETATLLLRRAGGGTLVVHRPGGEIAERVDVRP
jgi:predicted ATPase